MARTPRLIETDVPVASRKMKSCYFCNETIPDDSRVCPWCGRRQRLDVEVEKPPTTADQTEFSTMIEQESTMDKWEYLTLFLTAHHDNWQAKESIAFFEKESRHLTEFKPAIYSPQYMIALLNSMGEEGWELIHMEPVANVGVNHDVLFVGEARSYSNRYFCVFKRRKQ